MRRKLANGNIAFNGLLILALSSILALLVVTFYDRSGIATKDIIIPRKATLSQVANLLHDNRIIEHPMLFKLLLRGTGGNSRVRAGEFRFRERMSPWNALRVLFFGEQILHSITIPEGFTIKQIAGLLASQKLVDEQKFLQLTLTREAAAKHGLQTPHLEGFLFPDTYQFSMIDGEEKIIATMLQNFKQRYEHEYKRPLSELGWTVEKLVTLASIVEKETAVAEERPLIASVFLNRLAKKMRLQSDPTTIYGLGKFSGNLRKDDLLRPTPYNTYTISGLPLGPISNPGQASLRAVLFPAQSNYLYFVSNNHGKHIFSRSYTDHSRHVNSYQKIKRPTRGRDARK
ncbi:MAG: endolytic transglycosylase MltG [Deltaproteobacteria bacterium]|nr:endolytic transglycosylase MltG [Deltaproteobacteria bacterium]